ncbi:MAG: OmpA family protein [Nanobdellota archaeon]
MKKHIVWVVVALVVLSAVVVSVQNNLLSVDMFMNSFDDVKANKGVADNSQQSEVSFWEHYASFKQSYEDNEFDNIRSSSKYSGSQVFLAKSDSWQDVLKATTLSAWNTENFGECSYNPYSRDAVGRCLFPLFIIHDNDMYSIEDTLSRLEAQQSPNSNIDYEYKMFSKEDSVDVSFNGASVETVSPEDYESFWSGFDTAVIVSNDYETALHGAIISSRLNAPLFIKGYDDPAVIERLLDDDSKQVVLLSSSATDFSWKDEGKASCYVDMSVGPNTPDLYELHLLFDTDGERDGERPFFKPMISKLLIYNSNDLSTCQEMYGSFFNQSGMSFSPSVLCKDSLMVPYLAVAYNQMPLSLQKQKTLNQFVQAQDVDSAEDIVPDVLASYDVFGAIDDYFDIDTTEIDGRVKETLDVLNRGRSQLEQASSDDARSFSFDKASFTFVANPYSAPIMRTYFENSPSLWDDSAPGSLYLILPFFDDESYLFSDELSTGIVTGLTVSDTSSLVMKNIFLDNVGDALMDIDQSRQATGNHLHVVFGSTNPSSYDYLDFASLTHLPIENKFSVSVSRAEYFSVDDPATGVVAGDDLFASDLFRHSFSRQVVFDFDKSELVDFSKDALDTVMWIILLPDREPTIESLRSFELEAHTDHKGTDEYNLKLSQDRADAIKEYLLKSCHCQCDKLQQSTFDVEKGSYVSSQNSANSVACVERDLSSIKQMVSSECSNKCSMFSNNIVASGFGETNPRVITQPLYEELCGSVKLNLFDDSNTVRFSDSTCDFLKEHTGQAITKELLDTIEDPSMERAVRALNRRAEFSFVPEEHSPETPAQVEEFSASSKGRLHGDIFYYLGEQAPWISLSDTSRGEYDLVTLYDSLKPLPGYSPFYMFDSAPVFSYGKFSSLFNGSVEKPPVALLLTRFGGRGVYGFDARDSLFGQQEYFADVLFSDIVSPTFAGSMAGKLHLQYVKNTPETSCLARGASDCASSLTSRAHQDFASRFRFLGVPQSVIVPLEAKKPGRFSCIDSESVCGSSEYLEGMFPDQKHFIISSSMNPDDLFGGESNPLLSSLMPSPSESFFSDVNVDFVTSFESARLFSYPLLEPLVSEKNAGEGTVEVFTYVASPYEVEGMVSLVNDYSILKLDALPARHDGDFKTPSFNDYNVVGSEESPSNSFRKLYHLNCEVASEDFDSFIAAVDTDFDEFEYNANRDNYKLKGSGGSDWNIYKCSANVQPSAFMNNKNFPRSREQAVVFDVARKGTSAVFKRDILKTTTFARLDSIPWYGRLFKPAKQPDDGTFHSAADFFTDDGSFSFKIDAGMSSSLFEKKFSSSAFDVIQGVPETQGVGMQLPSQALSSQFNIVTYDAGIPTPVGELTSTDLKQDYGFGVDSVFTGHATGCYDLSDYFSHVRSFISSQSRNGAYREIDFIMPRDTAYGLVDVNYLDPRDVTTVHGHVEIVSPALVDGGALFFFEGAPTDTFEISSDELRRVLVDKPGVLDSFTRTASFSFFIDNITVEYDIGAVDRLYVSGDSSIVTENKDSMGSGKEPVPVRREMTLSRTCSSDDDRAGRDFITYIQEAEMLNKLGVSVS